MSRHRDLEARIRGLNDIREIMNAMKNLALMETHRLARFMDTQRRVVTNIESAASDFSHFHAGLLAGGEETPDACVLVGSERGFCGDFNESLLRAFHDGSARRPAGAVAVGARLGSKVAGDPEIAAAIPGVSVVEEVDAVLSNLVEELNRLRPVSTVTVFHHDPDDDGVRVSALKPFPPPDPAATPLTYAPLLYMEPKAFLAGIASQYLMALLHELLYRSLMAENQRRMQHMDSAIRLLERKGEDLWRRRNILRQEEITEEIEVIMLSVEAFG